MKRTTIGILWALLAALASSALFAQTEETSTFDPNATAESLGLKPFEPGFFPIFTWDHLENYGREYQTYPDGIKSTAECGCNLSAFVFDEDMVEMARQNGLKCIYELHFERFDERGLSPDELQAKLDAIDAAVKERVESTKDDPTVLGYFVVDEPGAFEFRGIAAALKAIEKYAPGKLAYVNLYPGYATTIGADADSQLGTSSYAEYLERFVQEVKPQFISYDNYMVEYSENCKRPDRTSQYFRDLFEVRRVALKYDLPFWFIGTSLCILEDSAPPTLTRYAYQAYTALAAGARSMVWYLYYPQYYPRGWAEAPIDKDGKKTLAWLYMRDVNQQLRSIGTYLLDFQSTELGMTPLYAKEDEPELPQFPSLPDNVLVNLKADYSSVVDKWATGETPKLMVGEFASQSKDAIAALAVNLDFESSVRIHFDMPEGYGKLKVVSPVDGTEQLVNEEAFASGFWLQPGHGRLFVFEK